MRHQQRSHHSGVLPKLHPLKAKGYHDIIIALDDMSHLNTQVPSTIECSIRPSPPPTRRRTGKDISRRSTHFTHHFFHKRCQQVLSFHMSAMLPIHRCLSGSTLAKYLDRVCELTLYRCYLFGLLGDESLSTSPSVLRVRPANIGRSGEFRLSSTTLSRY